MTWYVFPRLAKFHAARDILTAAPGFSCMCLRSLLETASKNHLGNESPGQAGGRSPAPRYYIELATLKIRTNLNGLALDYADATLSGSARELISPSPSYFFWDAGGAWGVVRRQRNPQSVGGRRTEMGLIPIDAVY